MPARLTIQHMQQVAASHDGKCLSETYVNNSTPLLWKCSKGHEFKAMPSNVVKPKGTWCPACNRGRGADSRRLVIQDMQKLAAVYGGECLSLEYKNNHTKLVWRCSEGHEFRMTQNNVQQGGWCKSCTKYISERVCRGIFEALFQEKFPRGRPSWLLSPQGNQMELDGYCVNLGLAFEYNGEQHYRDFRFWHRRRQTFHKRRLEDARKSQLCREHGIRLFIVPYTVKYDKMEEFIRNEAKEQGILVRRKTGVEWKNLPGIYSSGLLGRMQKMAAEYEGECLSPVYVNALTLLWWRCSEGHEWEATPNSVQQGHWCARCAGVGPMTIQEMHDLAKSYHGECLSTEYVNKRTKLRWRCAKGHEWSATPDNIKQGSWCPTCAKLRLKEPRSPHGQAVLNYIKEHQDALLRDVATTFNISAAAVYHIVHRDKLKRRR